MKKLLASLALPSVCTSLWAAPSEAWKKPMYCGSYKSKFILGVEYDTSKYELYVGRALDAAGNFREKTLYINNRKGSKAFISGKHCKFEGVTLTCVLADVTAKIYYTETPTKFIENGMDFYTYRAQITVPTTFGGPKTYDGSCLTDL